MEQKGKMSAFEQGAVNIGMQFYVKRLVYFTRHVAPGN